MVPSMLLDQLLTQLLARLLSSMINAPELGCSDALSEQLWSYPAQLRFLLPLLFVWSCY